LPARRAGTDRHAAGPDAETGLALPKKLRSLRFAVMGDVGRGDDAQYGTAAEMARWHERFDFSFVLMLGDNMYAAGTPEDYAARFERPYKPLLEKDVVFYAANGNHDPPNILDYPLYNMRGNRYYAFTKSEGALALRKVKFVAVDTVMLDSEQLAWLRRELGASDDGWEICFSITRSTRRAGTARAPFVCDACWSRCSVSSAWTWHWPGTSTCTNGWCRRQAFCISRLAPAARCAWGRASQLSDGAPSTRTRTSS
jgi:hypothetical protein